MPIYTTISLPLKASLSTAPKPETALFQGRRSQGSLRPHSGGREPPSDANVAEVVKKIRHRLRFWLRRRTARGAVSQTPEGQLNRLDPALGKRLEASFGQIRNAQGDMSRVWQVKPGLVEVIATLLAQDATASPFAGAAAL